MIKVDDDYFIDQDDTILDLVHTECREKGSWAIVASWYQPKGQKFAGDGVCAKCRAEISPEAFAKAKFIVESMRNG